MDNEDELAILRRMADALGRIVWSDHGPFLVDYIDETADSPDLQGLLTTWQEWRRMTGQPYDELAWRRRLTAP